VSERRKRIEDVWARLKQKATPRVAFAFAQLTDFAHAHSLSQSWLASQLRARCRELFKDEVRELGIALGVEPKSVWRHPFPGPGLAIRILGEVTAERVATLQEADAIMIEELWNAGIYRDIGQAFVVLLPVKTVGVMGDGRTYENCCSVRCVTTTDFMTADFYHMPYEVMGKISNRIINEVRGLNRVCYDISSKPPATIEWE